ncbi:MAG TPA: indole-3-glycerol-phosphate synthase [Acidimicrobiia bacterium]|nr:indole-3-glycerol-phosphate synthase [Acidimicrobiia bacterium]
MSDFLTEMAETSLLRARSAREGARVTGLQSRAASRPPPSPLALAPEGFDVIAEAKLASPSEGRITEGGEERVAELAAEYVSGGAAAISILTEESRFLGSLDHLAAVAAGTSVPVMRKDFLVDTIQVLEARAAGASGVLLIARLLPGELLVEMTDLTLDLGMFALIEIFDRSDLETAVRVFDREVLVGVNCRDLASLEVDFGRLGELAPHLPDHLPAVAESGLTEPIHAAEVAASGYRMALIGSSLASAEKPGQELAAYLASGRNRLERS